MLLEPWVKTGDRFLNQTPICLLSGKGPLCYGCVCPLEIGFHAWASIG